MRTEVQQFRAALPAESIDRATSLGLALAPNMSTDEWRKLVTQVAGLASRMNGSRQTLTAWLGDALAYGSARGAGLITECAEAAGLDPGTLRNAKMVCSRIPLSCRHDTLSWTHHCEVGLAFSQPDEIERWLALAETERLSTRELRRRVRAHLSADHRQHGQALAGSVTVFRLMRELRAVGRSLVRERRFWGQWSPSTAELALQELQSLADFVDVVRARAASSKSPANLVAN